MLYDDDFIISLPKESIGAIDMILDVFHAKYPVGMGISYTQAVNEDVFETRDLLIAIFELHNFDYRFNHTHTLAHQIVSELDSLQTLINNKKERGTVLIRKKDLLHC